MRFTTKTEYGLVCLVHMARQVKNDPVTVPDLVKRENMSETYVQKIFMVLRAAGIVTAYPGRNGGYALTRPAEEITLKDIIEALEGASFEIFCEPEVRKEIVCTHFAALCGLRPIWAKTKELLDQFYGSITLKMLARGEYEMAGTMYDKNLSKSSQPELKQEAI